MLWTLSRSLVKIIVKNSIDAAICSHVNCYVIIIYLPAEVCASMDCGRKLGNWVTAAADAGMKLAADPWKFNPAGSTQEEGGGPTRAETGDGLFKWWLVRGWVSSEAASRTGARGVSDGWAWVRWGVLGWGTELTLDDWWWGDEEAELLGVRRVSAAEEAAEEAVKGVVGCVAAWIRECAAETGFEIMGLRVAEGRSPKSKLCTKESIGSTWALQFTRYNKFLLFVLMRFLIFHKNNLSWLQSLRFCRIYHEQIRVPSGLFIGRVCQPITGRVNAG